MVGHGAKFGRKKEEAIAAMLSQPSLEAAARTLGISVQTLYRWLKIPEFKKSYLEARREVVSQANARMQQNSGFAASTLLKVMVSQDVPASVRIRAALSVMQLSQKSLQDEDLEIRLADVEAALNKNDAIQLN